MARCIATRRPSRCVLAPWAAAPVWALLGLTALALAGCTWSRNAAPAVPVEIARCRELTERGTLAMQEGELAAAEVQFRNALSINPADIDARRLFAEALWARGEVSAALAQIGAASQLAPHDSALAVRAGEMSLAVGDLTGAQERAARAIAVNPRYGPAWGLRGQVNWATGQREKAVADLQQALVHSPSDQRVLLSLARLYLEQGEPRRALTTLHQLLDSCPPGTEPQDALFLEGQAYLALGRAADAADSLYAAAERGKPGAEVYYLLARAESERGRTDAAARAAHLALAANSAHRDSLRLLAELNQRSDAPPALLRR